MGMVYLCIWTARTAKGNGKTINNMGDKQKSIRMEPDLLGITRKGKRMVREEWNGKMGMFMTGILWMEK